MGSFSGRIKSEKFVPTKVCPACGALCGSME